VLVTGGAGFIGSHLVDSLLDSGHVVMAVDNYSFGRPDHLTKHGDRQLTVVEADVRSATDLRPVADFAPEIVIHLAALHFIPYCEEHPREATEVNVLGLESTIRAIRKAPIRAFAFASSGAVYGFGDRPWAESDPVNPRDVYSLSKWMGEGLVRGLHQDRPDVRTVILRIFNTYGPRETNPHVIPTIMKALRDNAAIEMGNLWPRRDLIYVTDTVSGILTTIEGEPRLTTYNVATGVARPVNDVLDIISNALGRPLDVRQDAGRTRSHEGDLSSDSTRLKNRGWQPRYDLESGLLRLLKHEELL
jgi:UDP-glucose 4-epimerase